MAGPKHRTRICDTGHAPGGQYPRFRFRQSARGDRYQHGARLTIIAPIFRREEDEARQRRDERDDRELVDLETIFLQRKGQVQN